MAHVERPTYQLQPGDTVLLGTLNTSVGPCLVDLTYRWLLPEPAVTQLRLLGSTGWDAARPA
jgi:hypothetical protein